MSEAEMNSYRLTSMEEPGGGRMDQPMSEEARKCIRGANNRHRYKIYCGGTFCFDARHPNFKEAARRDYRAVLLGDVDKLLYPPTNFEVEINHIVSYIGPFYFESENMEAEDIIRCEKSMIDSCTDAIFLLDDAACPGTVSEIMYANTLGCRLHIVYIRRAMNEETESELHSPCWYPILFCKIHNKNATVYSSSNRDEATETVRGIINSMSNK